MRETDLTRKILKLLKEHGGFWVKIGGSPSQVTGLPDIIGCYRGYFVGLEVKLPGKESTLTDRQRLMLQRIQRAEGISKMITSAQAALEIIQAIDTQADLDDYYYP